MSSEIKANTISEVTSANGVSIDGVNLKDSAINTGAIGSSVTGNWGWKLLQTVSANNDTTELDVGSTDGGTSTLLTSTYSLYKFIISDLACAGSGRDLFIRFYKGSGLKTTEYEYTVKINSSYTDGHGRANSADAIRVNGGGIQQYDGDSNPTRFQGLNGEINLFDPSSNQFHFIDGTVTFHNSSNYNENGYFSGGNGRHQSHNGTGNGYDPIKYLRFYWSGGNIFRGTIRLYGVINA